MATWLGIVILVLFSLGLNWFMRVGRQGEPAQPLDLGLWVRTETESKALTGCYWEKRQLLVPGSLFGAAYIVEQRRLRRAADGEILQVLPEERVRLR